MNSLKIAFRRLFRKGEHTVTRIVSLAMGLSFSLLLLAEVFYFYSYDSFYPDADRIYVVHENFKVDKSSDQLRNYSRVSGAIAPGLKAEVPGIELATRLNPLGSSIFYTDDFKRYKASFSLADEYLFDVLPRPVLQGNAEEVLKSPMSCMVSSEVAEDMGGDVVGKVIELKEYPGKKVTIAGVFEALPENTNYNYDVLVSMVSIDEFMWDGRENWLGNDRYYACVKLEPGVDPKSLAPAVRKMQEKHQDIEALEETQQGFVLKYSFEPITKIHVANVKDMILVLSIIAAAVLFVSMMNYILLTLSALVNRAKTSAIHKTCGALSQNLLRMIFTETFLLFLISLAGAALIILLLRPLAETQLDHQLVSVLNPTVIWPLLGVITVLVVLISYLPGKFFSRIPVATAFRDYRQKRNKWKLALLSLQFIGASFILTVLVIVSLQYDKMKDADHGYRTEGVYYGSTSGMDGRKLSAVLHELRSMPEIELVGMGDGVPTDGASGNNVLSPDGERELFNVADFYFIDENYLSILDIPVLRGQNFSEETAVSHDLLISDKGAEMLLMNNGWTDGVLGKELGVTEHGSTTIRGVFDDFIIRSMASPDTRPAVFFYMSEEKFAERMVNNPSFSFNILVKAHPSAEAGLPEKMAAVFNRVLPHQDAVIKSLQDEQQKSYLSEKGFRNAMMAGNFIILLITVIGLLGYTANEGNRRRKELAIRRISGANLSDILQAFITDLEYIAIPAVLIGLSGAWIITGRWMQNFASKIDLLWEIFAGCSLFFLMLIALIAAVNYTRIANRNPIEALRYE